MAALYNIRVTSLVGVLKPGYTVFQYRRGMDAKLCGINAKEKSQYRRVIKLDTWLTLESTICYFCKKNFFYKAKNRIESS